MSCPAAAAWCEFDPCADRDPRSRTLKRARRKRSREAGLPFEQGPSSDGTSPTVMDVVARKECRAGRGLISDRSERTVAQTYSEFNGVGDERSDRALRNRQSRNDRRPIVRAAQFRTRVDAAASLSTPASQPAPKGGPSATLGMLVAIEKQALSRCRDLTRVRRRGRRPTSGATRAARRSLPVLDSQRVPLLWIFNGRPLRGVELPCVGHALELMNAARYQGGA
jgi:hypothetical protein